MVFLISKLIRYIIPIIVIILLILAYYNPGAAFDKVKAVFTGIKENVDIGEEQIQGSTPTIPQEHQTAIEFLKGIIEIMHNSGKKECFLNYQLSDGGSDEKRNGFPLLGEKGTTIIMERTSEGTSLTILGGVEGAQQVSQETLSGIYPCVISGTSQRDNIPVSIPENFFFYKLAKAAQEDLNALEQGVAETVLPQLGNDELNQPHFNPVQKIIIRTDGRKNKISYNDGPTLDFEDGGFLYTPDGQHICFFPTKDGDRTCDGNSNEAGLDDQCLGNADAEERTAIPNLISQNKLQICSSQ